MPLPLPAEWLVDESCTLVKPDGRRVATSIRIGHPAQLGGEALPDNYESHCWARVDGLVEVAGPVNGSSTLFALVSALSLIGSFAEWRGDLDGDLVDDRGERYAVLLEPFRIEDKP